MKREMLRNIVSSQGEKLLTPRPNPKLEDQPLSAVRNCLFSINAATLHICSLFLYPLPDDALSCGDRDSLIMAGCKYNH
jgi:hypothetical protein